MTSVGLCVGALWLKYPFAVGVEVLGETDGDRLRAVGTAEIARYDATPSPARAQAIIEEVLQTAVRN